MSTTVLTNEGMSKLSKALYQLTYWGFNATQISLNNETLTELKAFNTRDLTGLKSYQQTEKDFYNFLFKMNYDEYNRNYKEYCENWEQYKNQELNISHYSYDTEKQHIKLTPDIYHIYKLLQCLLYNIDGNKYQSQYKALEAVQGKISHLIIENTPEYNNFKWGS